MNKIKAVCSNCKGLEIIGTSVGSNHSRGSSYDCDVCHGLGYVELFSGLSETTNEDKNEISKFPKRK